MIESDDGEPQHFLQNRADINNFHVGKDLSNEKTCKLFYKRKHMERLEEIKSVSCSLHLCKEVMSLFQLHLNSLFQESILLSSSILSSVPEPVRDGQQKVIFLQCLYSAERLFIQGEVATPGVVQQLLLGRVKLSHFSHFLRGHEKQLSNGCGGGHCVAVHPVYLEGLGHVFEALVRKKNLLIAKKHSCRIFH